MKVGILYIALDNGGDRGDRFLKEATYSACSIKKAWASVKIALFTNVQISDPVFDIVKRVPSDLSGRVKQDLLMDSPFERTLYLDSDTEIKGPIEPLFDLLDRFDIAATHDLIRKDSNKAKVYPAYAQITEAFPELGGGVLLFKKTEAVNLFFAEWQRNYRTWVALSGRRNDQPSLRVSAWQCSDLKLFILPPEYNIRTKKYTNAFPRILHEHDLHLSRFERRKIQLQSMFSKKNLIKLTSRIFGGWLRRGN